MYTKGRTATNMCTIQQCCFIFRVQVQSCTVDCLFKSWQTTKINNRRRQTVPHGHNSLSAK